MDDVDDESESASSTGSGSGSRTSGSVSGGSKKKETPNKLKVEAGVLKVEAESKDESVEELAGVCNEQMEVLMEHQLVGELQHIEEKNIHEVLFGGRD